MTNQTTEFDYSTGGWVATPTGQIKRAADIRQRLARLLNPFWGPVAGEPYRGNLERPKKQHDAIATQIVDRIYLLLSPAVAAGDVTLTSVAAVPSNQNPKFVIATIRGMDRQRKPFTLQKFVAVPGA